LSPNSPFSFRLPIVLPPCGHLLLLDWTGKPCGVRESREPCASLFRHSFRLAYIAPFTVHFTRAEQCLSSLVKTALQAGVSGELERYVRLRAAWDGKHYGTLSSDDIEWLHQANKRSVGPRIEQLYAVWCSSEIPKEEYGALLRDVSVQLPVPKAPLFSWSA
jgi:hypothetical protein